jgi:extradiol dioxygenase family protein
MMASAGQSGGRAKQLAGEPTCPCGCLGLALEGIRRRPGHGAPQLTHPPPEYNSSILRIPFNQTSESRMSLSPFHLAIPVYDLSAARRFYGEVFGLAEGRSSTQWVDFDFYGHQLVIHEHPKTASQDNAHTNPVDGHDVPVPHFGIVLQWAQWEALAERLKSFGTKFVIEPYVRFKGQVGEQATMFLLDPCGNALEFKAFKDMGQLFAK